MPIDLVWSNQAHADLLDIYVRIGREQRAAAERYLDRIEAKAELLKLQPRMGIRRSDIRPSMRILVESPYLLLYRTDPDTDDGPIHVVEIILSSTGVGIYVGCSDLVLRRSIHFRGGLAIP